MVLLRDLGLEVSAQVNLVGRQEVGRDSWARVKAVSMVLKIWDHELDRKING